jgi:DNA-binding protein Fis
VLTQQGGQKQKAAEILGIGRSTLDRKIEKYGL